MKKILALVGLCAVLSSCSRNPVTGKKEIVFMSQEQEIALGAQSHPSIVATMGLYDDTKLSTFINQRGKAMAAISHRPDLPYQFYVVDSPVVNAFAVPGGYIYFTRGILAHFNNTAEFSGVLGHEIGHVTARHSARQQTSQLFGNLGLMAGMIFSPTVRQLGEQASQAMQVLMLSYSRDHETESDKLGVSYSSKIGSDARYMAPFFGTLKRMSGKAGSVPTFLSTHPDPGQREVNVNRLAVEYQTANPGTYTVDRDSYLRLIDGIVYGDDPKQGFVENNMFYHPEMRFQFPVPPTWQTQNSPAQFQMAPKEGGNMAVLLSAAEGANLTEAAQKTAQQFNFKVMENANVTINGIPALVMVSQIQPQQEQGQQPQAQDPAKVVQVASWFYQLGNQILVMHGMTYAPNFNAAFPTFKGVANNFRVLTDPDKINRKPERILIKTVPRSTTFREVMRGFGMPETRLEELGLLNQLQPTDAVATGSLIKIIGK